ncbi:RDD family protein [Actinoplanes sp. NPDC051470]|uniref:RDD family protein n=1 Tax=unclassified Actinoplanes TaxID=2626549 RepID=UPI003439CB86
MTYQPYPPYQGPQQPAYRPLPQPMSPGGQPLADFGTRLLAYLIDGALAYAVILVVSAPFWIWIMMSWMDTIQSTYADEPDFVGDLVGPLLLLELGLILFVLVAYWFYHVEYMHRSGQTVGKKLMKLRVVPIDPNARLTRGMAAKRYVVEILGGVIIPFFSYLDGLWQLWDKPYLQTLHDKFAQTVVVKVGP